jgi:hypothetical protein
MTHVATNTNPDLDLRKELADYLTERDGHLGMKSAFNPLVPMLRSFVKPQAAPPPVAVHRSFYGFKSGMLGNDSIGDCVIAQVFHALIHVHHVLGLPIPDVDALTAMAIEVYSAVTGYVPGDPSTDQGSNPPDAYAFWKQVGLPFPDDAHRHQIDVYAQILPHDGVNIMRAIYACDSVGLSLAMPQAWQGAATWDVGGDPNTDPAWQPGGWGGHQVLGVSYDRRNIAVWTWGGVKLLTWRAWGTYGELALTQASKDWIGNTGVSETGLDLAALEKFVPTL